MKECLTVPLSTLSDDPYLAPYLHVIRRRKEQAVAMQRRLTEDRMSLEDFASGHEYFGLHRKADGGLVFREWAPNAHAIYLVGDFSGWRESDKFALRRAPGPAGVWEIELDGNVLQHGALFRLRVHWPGGHGDRIPAFARRVVQDDRTKIFNAQAWLPPEPYRWKHPEPAVIPDAPLIYEAHVGMAQQREGVGTYTEFKDNIIPRIVDAGYNTIQLMAVMEHPYYGSFGYQVSSFFAASSRFGTPEELKALVDEAHGAGLMVIMDLIHSHAVKNEVEGISRFDGTLYQYFHEGNRGNHPAWDSRCFNYAKPEVLHFLLSNCRYWLDEFKFDGFRFDGITSMLYIDHGFGIGFGHYDRYFDQNTDEDAVSYLTLANKLIHSVRPHAITIAEDVSGMPGLAARAEDGGCGFDCRLAMGIPDCWFKLVDETRDEDWDMNSLWHELTNRRGDERTISYAECHDQALVGGKTLIFEMIDADMYDFMRVSADNLMVERGIALHKMIRLITVATATLGYLNFMGNEFGHPEWIDFPRDGNNWSYHYARRLWRLRDNPDLKYHALGDFDQAMMKLLNANGTIPSGPAMRLVVKTDDKVIVFGRGDLFFFFNFHPSRSFVDYGVEVPPGEYTLELDTDEPRFGGRNRLIPGQQYTTTPARIGNAIRNYVRVYLPCRTALVLKRKRGTRSLVTP